MITLLWVVVSKLSLIKLSKLTFVGASGIVTAERLVETGKTVLLLERGGPSYYSTGGNLTVPWNHTTSVYEVPGMFMGLSKFPGNKGYCSDTAGMAGCILGGGTTVNGMAFIKPPSFDFENWPAGWQWTDGVKEAADRLYERNPGTETPSVDGKFYDDAVYEVLSKWFETSAGWHESSTNDAPDDKLQMFSRPAMNIMDGRRQGPVRAYLPLAMGKKNFKLKLFTKVLRAIRTGPTVSGVETEDGKGNRIIYNVNAGGKVILAAGSMSSPRILFNSGIGPVDQIEVAEKQKTSIELPPKEAWINLPVGFVRDHSIIDISFNVTQGDMEIMSLEEYTNPNQTEVDMFAHATGPLVGNPQMRLNSFTTITTSDNHKIVVQTHCYSLANNTINMMFLLTHGSTSTGRLTMTHDGNTEFSESPYLVTDTDKEAMAMAIDEMLAASRKQGSTLAYSGPANDTGAAIVARTKPSPGTHMTGTTIIGTEDGTKNGSAVVDLDCKVYGTDNLFVVDAGMHADLPSGNTHVIVMVAAEHAVKKIIALDGGMSVSSPTSPTNGTAPPALPVTGGGYEATTVPTVPELPGSGIPEAPKPTDNLEEMPTFHEPGVEGDPVSMPGEVPAPTPIVPVDDHEPVVEPIGAPTGEPAPLLPSDVPTPADPNNVPSILPLPVDPEQPGGPNSTAPAVSIPGDGYNHGTPEPSSTAAPAIPGSPDDQYQSPPFVPEPEPEGNDPANNGTHPMPMEPDYNTKPTPVDVKPETPGTPEAPGAPGAPETPATPETPAVPETPATPSTPTTPGAPAAPIGSGYQAIVPSGVAMPSGLAIPIGDILGGAVPSNAAEIIPGVGGSSPEGKRILKELLAWLNERLGA